MRTPLTIFLIIYDFTWILLKYNVLLHSKKIKANGYAGVIYFSDNPYLIILEESLMSLPGIERVDLLFFNKDSGKLELHCIERKRIIKKVNN